MLQKFLRFSPEVLKFRQEKGFLDMLLVTIKGQIIIITDMDFGFPLMQGIRSYPKGWGSMFAEIYFDPPFLLAFLFNFLFWSFVVWLVLTGINGMKIKKEAVKI